jgi:hypothetical protein
MTTLTGQIKTIIQKHSVITRDMEGEYECIFEKSYDALASDIANLQGEVIAEDEILCPGLVDHMIIGKENITQIGFKLLKHEGKHVILKLEVVE